MDWIGRCLVAGGLFSLIGLAGWILHRWGLLGLRFAPRRSYARLQASDRLMLSAHHTLHLIRTGDRGLLVAVYPSGCTLLDSRPWSEWAPIEEHLSQ